MFKDKYSLLGLFLPLTRFFETQFFTKWCVCAINGRIVGSDTSAFNRFKIPRRLLIKWGASRRWLSTKWPSGRRTTLYEISNSLIKLSPNYFESIPWFTGGRYPIRIEAIRLALWFPSLWLERDLVICLVVDLLIILLILSILILRWSHIGAKPSKL